MTLGGRETAEMLARFGLQPRKALGQNFVVDPNTIERIVRLSGVTAGERVIEVGPGLGALTLGLADVGAEVTVLELDDALLPAITERTAGRGIKVIHGDATSADWAVICPGEPWHMVANLPYNVGTSVVLDVLDDAPHITELTVMLQREVIERLAASPGSDAYGIPSVKVAFWATAEIVARVPASVFLPRPKVESAVVRISRLPEPAVDADPELVFSLVKQAFGQRRKMLRKSLGNRVGAATFEAAGVDPAQRPEQLDVHAWGRIANCL